MLFDEVVAAYRMDLAVASSWCFDCCRRRAVAVARATDIAHQAAGGPESVRNLPREHGCDGESKNGSISDGGSIRIDR